MTTTETDFITALDASPEDWGLRMVYADWLEEQGELAFAECQRWMVENKKRPYPGSLFSWVWFRSSFGGLMRSEIHYQISDQMQEDCFHETRQYRSRHAAELDLCQALQKAGVME